MIVCAALRPANAPPTTITLGEAMGICCVNVSSVGGSISKRRSRTGRPQVNEKEGASTGQS